MASFFPKALVFKEWRQQRMWGLLLCLVLCGPMVLTCFGLLMNLWSQPDPRAHYWQMSYHDIQLNNMRNTILAVLGHTQYYGTSSLASYFLFAVAVFGATIVTYDRNNGGLWYTLSGPFTRRQVLRVKAAFGALVVVGILTLFALLLYLFNAVAHTEIELYWFLRWWGYELLLQLAIFMCAILGATLVGHSIVAPVAGLGIAGIPGAISVYVRVLGATSGNVYTNDTPIYHAAQFIESCSPLYYLNYNAPDLHLIWLVPCAIIWIVVGYIAAHRFFFAAALERMSNFFTFPALWKWLMWGISVVGGMVLTEFSSQGYQPGTLEFLLKHVLFTAVIWFILRWFIRIYRKKFVEV